MRRTFFTLLIAVGFFCALPVFATDYYVDGDSGSDATGVGSQVSPYKTITKAVSILAGGDTVYCKGTISDGDINLTNTQAGTANGYTTFTAWPGYSPVIDASIGGPRDTVFQFNSGANYIKISNLELKGGALYNIYGSIGGVSEYLELTNNKFNGTNDLGFNAPIYLGSFNHVSIIGNEISGDGDDNYGLYLTSSDSVIIEKNKIHNFIRWAIAAEGVFTNNVIKNNIVYNISGDASYPFNGGIVLAGGNNNGIYNNTIYNTYSDTIEISGIKIIFLGMPISNITVKNNIIDKANTGIFIYDNARLGFSSDYNDFYNVNKIGNWASTDQTTITDWQTASNNDRHSIISDPLLTMITAGSENLHLQSTSPCIDAGQLISDLTNDYDDEARPYNLTDIGADEYALLTEAPIPTSSVAGVSTANLQWYFNDLKFPITQYYLKLNTQEDLSSTIASNYSTKEIELSSLAPAQTYYYAVQADYLTSYAYYSSSYSSVANFTTYPAQVTDIKVPKKHKLKHKVTIKWLKQERVDGYYLKLMHKNGKAIITYNINKNKAKKYLTKLSSKTTYQVKIRSRKTVGDSYLLGDWSEVKKFTTR